MITQSAIQKADLDDFIDTVEKERRDGLFVTGLIIRKSSTALSVENIAKKTPGAVVAQIATGISDPDILSAFREAFEKKEWLVLHLSDGSLPPMWREQLSRLRDSNSVFIQGETAQKTFFAEQSKETRVLVVIDERGIENVQYPAFFSLFGPVTEL